MESIKNELQENNRERKELCQQLQELDKKYVVLLDRSINYLEDRDKQLKMDQCKDDSQVEEGKKACPSCLKMLPIESFQIKREGKLLSVFGDVVYYLETLDQCRSCIMK